MKKVFGRMIKDAAFVMGEDPCPNLHTFRATSDFHCDNCGFEYFFDDYGNRKYDQISTKSKATTK
jgi:hypothetical protein